MNNLAVFVIGGEDIMDTMTVIANRLIAGDIGCRLFKEFDRCPVKIIDIAIKNIGADVIICHHLSIGMTSRATDLFGSGFVRGALYVGVAVHAGEHAAVDGILERFRIDMQANRLAIDLVGERGVAVAGEALISGRLGRFLFPGSRQGGCG